MKQPKKPALQGAAEKGDPYDARIRDAAEKGPQALADLFNEIIPREALAIAKEEIEEHRKYPTLPYDIMIENRAFLKKISANPTTQRPNPKAISHRSTLGAGL